MILRFGLLGVTWVVMMALAGAEFLISGVHMALPNRPVVLAPAGLMVVIVVVVFMRLPRAPVIARGFALVAIFWLILLLGLGSMDALTRNFWWVQGYRHTVCAGSVTRQGEGPPCRRGLRPDAEGPGRHALSRRKQDRRVQDNLSSHKPASLYESFPAAEASRLVERFEWHYTPKHGGWLNMAESELGILSSRRIPASRPCSRKVPPGRTAATSTTPKRTGSSPPPTHASS